MKTALTPPVATLAALAELVVKQGIGLGGLAPAQRALALAFVWAGLPADLAMDERGVNEALKAQLQGAAAYLDTDHVELRRWLVDAGLMVRDGFGREYRKRPVAQLPLPLQPVAAALQGLDTAAFARTRREGREAERRAQRAAWQARQMQQGPVA